MHVESNIIDCVFLLYSHFKTEKIPNKSTTPQLPGTPQNLISWITHLQNLCHSLPETLPLNPPVSTHNFGLDDEKMAEYRALDAFSANMEICFETFWARDKDILFAEHGQWLETLILTIKTAVKKMSDLDWTVFHKAWLERLIKAATLSGARLPKWGWSPSPPLVCAKCTKNIEDIILASEPEPQVPEHTPTQPHCPPQSSSCAQAPDLNYKQVALASLWKPLSEYTEAKRQTYAAQGERNQQRDEEERRRAIEDKKKELMRREEHQQKLAHEHQQCHWDKKSSKKDENKPKGLSVNTILMGSAMAAAEIAKVAGRVEVAEVSQTEKKAWRKSQNGKLGGMVQQQVKRTNWYHPFLWSSIDSAMHRAEWSPGGAIKIL